MLSALPEKPAPSLAGRSLRRVTTDTRASGITQKRPMRVTSKPANDKARDIDSDGGLITSVGMSNVLSEAKKQQVIALGKLGWPLRRIEQATGVRRETAGAYLKAAGIAVRPPGSWGRRAPAKSANEVTPDSGAVIPPGEVAAAKPANEVTPDFGLHFSHPDRCSSDCEPYRELIEQGLGRGRNAKAIWQDLVSDHGFSSGYQAVKRFVRRLRGAQLPAVGIILTAAGEECQVDYGSGPMVRHPQSGKYRRTRLFVMTLGYSRKSIRLLVWRSSSRVWAELHEQAFRRLGGCPRIVVLDNLREGVIVPDIYDPTINPLFRDVLAHYGVVALPCRIKDPDRKAYVSYCTSSHFCNVESRLLGLSASAASENRTFFQRFI